jgi:hypothetical protein
MSNFSFDLLTISILILLTTAIYTVILVVFINARRKYKGGIIALVIKFIIATIGLYLIADMSLFLVPEYGFQLGYSIHVILKISAMTCLAIGGLEFFTK